MDFNKAYSRLNKAQKNAVDTLDGPVLVVAGPGTGKTQILTTRVANILKKTDTDPNEILCLTFTEAAATNMKIRLSNLIGRDSYDVNINTYHGFGNELIRSYKEFFPFDGLPKPAEDLIVDKIYRKILHDLPYSNLLKGEYYLPSIKSTISRAKREFILPDNLDKQIFQKLIY